VLVWNRTPERLEPLLDAGAEAAATPREAAARSHILITMLADPEALRSVSNGGDGIAAGVHPGLTVIEMSTVGPAAIQRLAATLPEGAMVVDAPVLGSIAEAEAGTLTIFAGGSADVVEAVEPLLSELGAVVRAGPLGAGAAAKLVANASVFGTLTILGEVLAFADALGVERRVSAAVLASTPLAAQAKRRMPAIESGSYPRRFALLLARKDADLIRDTGRGAGVATPALNAARRWLCSAELAGRGGEDYTAMLATILGGTDSLAASTAEAEHFDYRSARH
jgi:3-hydroxyisobutyrate dehydrogenase-like beta-hydroxyacid dehydrogenase